MFEVLDYLSPDGNDPYIEWLAGLADRQARARILVRVQRMAAGNFGDCKPLQDGGDKRKQQADIAQALERWHDWQHRRKSP